MGAADGPGGKGLPGGMVGLTLRFLPSPLPSTPLAQSFPPSAPAFHRKILLVERNDGAGCGVVVSTVATAARGPRCERPLLPDFY